MDTNRSYGYMDKMLMQMSKEELINKYELKLKCNEIEINNLKSEIVILESRMKQIKELTKY